MGENSHIGWTDHTFNGWIGCTKRGPECLNCYAENLMDTRYGRVQWGPQGTRVRTSEANWRKPLAWNRKALDTLGRRARVFAFSLADIFEDRPELTPWREDFWEMVEETTNLQWLLLTKRPESVLDMVPSGWKMSGFPDHVGIGTSVGTQRSADRLIPHLLGIPASLRFLSLEPLLEEVDVSPYLEPIEHTKSDGGRLGFRWTDRGIHWVITGGESGPGARRSDVEWIRSIATQCKAAGVPVFVKQLGARPVDSVIRWVDPKRQALSTIHDPKGADPEEWPEDLRVQEFAEGF